MLARVRSDAGGVIQVRLDGSDGPVIAEVKIPKTGEWETAKADADYLLNYR